MASGVLCQLLLLRSSLCSVRNAATIAFSTPTSVAPSGMLMCFNSTAVRLDPSTFSVLDMLEGGDLFSPPTRNITTGTSWPAEFGTLRDVTGTDSFYSGSYFNQRLDNLGQDSTGQSITGLVTFPPPNSVNTVVNGHHQSGNCVLLSGAWQQGTLYQMTFTFYNPPCTSAASAIQPMPALWITPVTTTVLAFGDLAAHALQSASITIPSGITFQEASYSIRGSKYGAVCAVRPAVAAVLGTLWSPCGVLGTAMNVDWSIMLPEDCLSLLQKLTSNTTGFPYNTPPLKNYTVDSWPDPPCELGQARSARFGGQCVDCGSGTLQGGQCVCPAGVARSLLGSPACPRHLGSDGSPASTQALGSQLCTSFSNMQARWQNRTLTAKSVARLGLKAFATVAASVVDWTAITNANTTFYANYVFDDRHPASPTRKYGIKPSCTRCEGGPYFKNVFSGNRPAKLFDYQFDAMNVLRLIGYILDTLVGVPCAALWDRNNPLEWKYGFYEDILCQPIH